MPPVVRLPVAPGEFTAERRATTTYLEFTVPATNSDGTRPANIQRVDIYALTGSPTVSDEDVLKLGTKIATIEVKGPRDPDDVVGADDSDADLEPLQGAGLDQGVRARVRENLSLVAPAAAASADVARRQYLAVGVSIRGRNGLLSRRVAVPMVAPPPAPSKLEIAYDERDVRMIWAPVASDDTLPAGPLAYHLYEVATSSSAATASSGTDLERRITTSPAVDTRFVDERIEWDVERCYAVSSLRSYGDNLTAESAVGPLTCVKFSDTFAPAAPVGLTPVSSDGTINLTWDRNIEKDLAGYLVLRGAAPGESLVAITPKPIEETTFKDSVPSGVLYRYAVQAVDKAGNVSPPSSRVETAAP